MCSPLASLKAFWRLKIITWFSADCLLGVREATHIGLGFGLRSPWFQHTILTTIPPSLDGKCRLQIIIKVSVVFIAFDCMGRKILCHICLMIYYMVL